MNSPIEPVSKDTLKSSCLRLNAKLDVKMATANPRQLFSPTLRAIVAIVQQKRQGIYIQIILFHWPLRVSCPTIQQNDSQIQQFD